MLKVPFFVLICFLSVNVYAQQDAVAIKKAMMDSIKSFYIDEAAMKFPIIRQISVSQEITGSGNITSKLYGKDFFKGQLQTSTTIVNVNVPIWERGKNAFAIGIGLLQQHNELSNLESFDPRYPLTKMSKNLTTFNARVSYLRRDTLFGLPTTFSVNVNGLFDPSFSKQKINYTGLISVNLLHRRNTSFSLGLALIKDPASPVPAFLILNYYHRFESAKMDLMIDMPYRFALRKELNKKFSLMASVDLAGSNSFFNIGNSSLPQSNIYSTLSLKSGVMLEYRLSRKAVISLSGGMQNTLTSKILEYDAKPSDYFIKNKNSPVPYLKVGFSLLPFWKMVK